MKYLPDPRALVLTAILAVAASAILFATASDRRDYYFFDATLTSTTEGYTGVSWNFGNGFGIYDTSVQPLRADSRPVKYRYMLPSGTLSAFRFTVVDRPATLTISRARIVDGGGRIVREFGAGDFASSGGFRRLDRSGDSLVVETQNETPTPTLNLALPSPLDLPLTAAMKLRTAAPAFFSVLAIGYVLGLAPVIGLLKRWLSPVAAWAGRRPRTAICAAAALAVVVQSHPVIFSGRSFVSPANGSLMLYGHLPTLPGMTQAQFVDGMASDVGAMLFCFIYYPMVEREALLGHGELPLWNRYSLAGEPLLGQGQSMIGDPFNLITIAANGAAWAWDIRFLIAHFLLSAGLAAAVWQLTRHLPSALLTAVAGGFISYFTYRINHPANFSVAYAPWLLVSWIGLAQASESRSRLLWAGALVLANWTEFSSGTVKEAAMLIACLNLAGAIMVLHLPDAAGRRIRTLALGAAAAGVFVLLSAPLWLTFLDTLRHSFTGYDNPHADPLPAARFLGLFDDIFYRQNGTDEFGGAPGLNFVFLAGVLAWVADPRAWRSDPSGRALLLGSIIPLGFAFGFIPTPLVLKIPFIANIVHTGNTFSCSLLVLCGVLAGCGFHRAIGYAGGSGWAARAGIAALLAAALGAVYYTDVRSIDPSLFFKGYVVSLFLGVVSLALALRWGLRSGRIAPLAVALALALPILLWRHAQYNESSFAHYAFTPGKRADFHAPSPGVKFLNSLVKEPGRVIGWDASLFPAYHMALRWESPYGVDAIRSRFYQEVVGPLGLARVWYWDYDNPSSDASKFRPALDFLNVSHSIADRVDGPHIIDSRAPAGRFDIDVYASPSAWPRAFFTDQVAVYNTADDFAKMLTSGDGKPFAAVQAGASDAPPPTGSLEKRVFVPASDYRLTPNTTRFTVTAPGSGFAVLTETYYSGDFRVTVDGRPAAYFRVNHAFKGVRIEGAGRHEISFTYRPERLTLALWISAAGAAIAAATIVWQWRRSTVRVFRQAT